MEEGKVLDTPSTPAVNAAHLLNSQGHIIWSEEQRAQARQLAKDQFNGITRGGVKELSKRIGIPHNKVQNMVVYLKKQMAKKGDKKERTVVTGTGKLATKKAKRTRVDQWTDEQEALLIEQINNRTLTGKQITKKLKKDFGRVVKRIDVKMSELRSKLRNGTYVPPSQRKVQYGPKPAAPEKTSGNVGWSPARKEAARQKKAQHLSFASDGHTSQLELPVKGYFLKTDENGKPVSVVIQL